MKVCPICKATLFEDMEVCYGCMYRFARRTIDGGSFKRLGGSEYSDEPMISEPVDEAIPQAVSAASNMPVGVRRIVEAPIMDAPLAEVPVADTPHVEALPKGAPREAPLGEARISLGERYQLVITLEEATSSDESSAQADHDDRGRTPSSPS